MGLVFWWMLVLWGVGIVAYWGIRYYLLQNWRFKKPQSKAVPIAHSDRVTSLPEYKRALKQYALLVKIACGALSLALLMGIVLTARPQSIAVITPVQKSRDIMLCLDVSGSLLRVDTTTVNRFTQLVTQFSGQRVGLTVFNSSAVAIMPLNDDYDFTAKQLKGVASALQAQKGTAFDALTSGTLADFDSGTSLVSDGLVSCIGNLGQNTQNRSQSVILATDNEANGTPIVTEAQAQALAQERGIHVYAIDPGQSDASRTADHDQLKALATQTGGGYYQLSDSNTVSAIISAISDQEDKYTAAIPIVATADKPKPFLYIGLLATVTSLVLLRRLRI